MKMLKKALLLSLVIMIGTVLVSWNHPTKELKSGLRYSLYDKNGQDFTQAETAFYNPYKEWDFSGDPGGVSPTAEDVLIQKISGDNNHLLMMAFYSKENYSGQFVSIENGDRFVFRDDGKGYDKKAGDGLYTAKVAVDLNEFRQKASSMIAQMKKSGYKPIRFDHRTMIVDPDADESFDIQKWEKGETVSISGLTNALGNFDPSDIALSSGGSTNTVLSNNSASTVSIDAASVKVNTIRNNCVTITNLAVVEDPPVHGTPVLKQEMLMGHGPLKQ
jgi:hypothetical protein